MCGKGTPQYTAFMTSAGTCMMSCTQDEQNAFSTKEFPEACAWYNEHKDDSCNSSSGSASPNSTSSGETSNSSTNSESAASTLAILGYTSALAVGAAYYLV